MATPASGSIGMGHFRTEITRATSSQLSMSEIRTRNGSSGAISFSQLRKAEGFTIVPQQYSSGGKPPIDITGYSFSTFAIGSVSPVEVSSQLEFSAGARLSDFYSQTTDNTQILMAISPVATGFNCTDITRAVVANTAGTLSGATSQFININGIGVGTRAGQTVHCLIKF